MSEGPPVKTESIGVMRDAKGRIVAGSSKLPGGGHPKDIGRFRELCRKRTGAALNALIRALHDPDHAVVAAKALLEFGWGKAPADLHLSGEVILRSAKETNAELEEIIRIEAEKESQQ